MSDERDRWWHPLIGLLMIVGGMVDELVFGPIRALQDHLAGRR